MVGIRGEGKILAFKAPNVTCAGGTVKHAATRRATFDMVQLFQLCDPRRRPANIAVSVRARLIYQWIIISPAR